MRIGITGATGLIGGAFIELAAANGHEVIAYTRSDTPVHGATQTLQQPLNAPHLLPEARLDALVHLAGESLMGLWTRAKRERMWKSRVELTNQLVNQLAGWRAAHRPRILVSASGIGFYGSQGDKELTESSPCGSGYLANLCERWEAAARRASDLGSRVVSVRTSMVLSAEGGAYPLIRRAFRYGLGGRLGNGRQWMSWIHIADQVGLLLWSIENEAIKGPINLCAPQPIQNSDFTTKLAHHLHRPAWLHAPAFALRLLLRDMADEMLLCSQRAIPQVAMDRGYKFAHPNLDDALDAFNR